MTTDGPRPAQARASAKGHLLDELASAGDYSTNVLVAPVLRPVAGGIAAVFGLVVLLDLFVDQQPLRSLDTLPTFLTFLGFSLIYVGLTVRPPPVHWAHPIAGVMLLLGILHTMATLPVDPSVLTLMDLGLVVLAAGVLLLSKTWHRATLVTAFFAYGVGAQLLPEGVNWIAGLTTLLGATVLSVVAHDHRLRTTERLLELRERDARARRDLEEQTRLLQEAQRIGHIGHWSWDLVDDRMAWSDEFYRLLGLEPGGADPSVPLLLERVHPDDRDRVWRRVEAFQQGAEVERVEYRIVTPQGETRWVESRAAVRTDEQGRPVEAAGTLHDVTKRREAEQAREQVHRTAEEAARLKSDFLNNMSHEIRTPLNAIIGMSDLLLETRLQDTQEEYAQTIRNSSDYLLSLVNDLLDLSKAEQGRLELEEQPFALRTVVEAALDLVTPAADEKDLDLGYWMEPDVPEGIVGDAGRLRQVLVNLLSNGVKFTEAGQVHLRVDVEESDPNVVLRFVVRDTGIGIDPGATDHLFEAFTQADARTTREYGGTGLGLAISRDLVELMGGSIWVESEPGEGSTFTFTLPTKAVELDRPPVPTGVQERFKGRRAVVINHKDPHAHLLAYFLEAWGLEVELVTAWEEAVDAFDRGEEMDLVVFDARVPDLSREDLALRLARQRGRRIAAIAVGAPGIRKELRDTPLELAGVLRHPLKPASLFEALASAFMEGAEERVVEDTGVEPPAKPLEVLVVEDNLINQRVTQHMLDKLGYGSEVVGDGSEAVEAVERMDFDVVLMDLEMPEMDGYEATRRIRARPGGRQPIIIALTAHVGPQVGRRVVEAGMEGYLPKPVSLAQLHAILEERRQNVESDGGPPPAPSVQDGASSPGQPPLIDRDALEGLKDVVGAQELDHLITLFQEQLPALLQRLQVTLDEGDRPQLRATVHTLRGSAASLGAQRLGFACARLEQAASSGEQALQDRVREVSEVGHETAQALAEWRAPQTDQRGP